jgi:hypothetical protein
VSPRASCRVRPATYRSCGDSTPRLGQSSSRLPTRLFALRGRATTRTLWSSLRVARKARSGLTCLRVKSSSRARTRCVHCIFASLLSTIICFQPFHTLVHTHTHTHTHTRTSLFCVLTLFHTRLALFSAWTSFTRRHTPLACGSAARARTRRTSTGQSTLRPAPSRPSTWTTALQASVSRLSRTETALQGSVSRLSRTETALQGFVSRLSRTENVKTLQLSMAYKEFLSDLSDSQSDVLTTTLECC